jgi:hypothetical protein
VAKNLDIPSTMTHTSRAHSTIELIAHHACLLGNENYSSRKGKKTLVLIFSYLEITMK